MATRLEDRSADDSLVFLPRGLRTDALTSSASVTHLNAVRSMRSRRWEKLLLHFTGVFREPEVRPSCLRDATHLLTCSIFGARYFNDPTIRPSMTKLTKSWMHLWCNSKVRGERGVGTMRVQAS
jgi:hypothetical protein